MTSQDAPLPPPRDAGTLILVRPRLQDGVPELLMTQRASTMRFAGGAMVFPGGAVDARDRAFAGRIGAGGDGSGLLPEDDVAARIAAVRETIEECGLALTAGGGALSLEQSLLLRQALHRGEVLEDLLAEARVDIDFAGLVPFARWCPKSWETPIRYDTRFYIAKVEGRHDDLIPDGSETAGLLWVSAREMLARADRNEAHIIFPTRCNLERLAQFDTIDALIDHAGSHAPDLISPWRETRDGEEHICIQEGRGYPITSRLLRSTSRG